MPTSSCNLGPPSNFTGEQSSPSAEPQESGKTLEETNPDIAEQESEHDNIIPTKGYQMIPMVGLGGSAGSIPALFTFFETLPPDSGMVFVVILHLSPEHESVMADLLQRKTTMPVIQARDGQKVEANRVYVIPPGKHLISADGQLGLEDVQPEVGRRVAVDHFFRTLADTHGPHAIAIVLSGADGDGAIGIKRIKERGGLTIAQDPDEADHPSMPRAAIETGMVDWVLRVAEIPPRLIEYQQHAQSLKLPPEEGPQPAMEPSQSHDDAEMALREVLKFVKTQTGRDFSYYKRATIVRRISRRMQVNGVASMPEYLTFLRTHSGEAEILVMELLVSVTNFFRDQDSFAALKAHVPQLFKNKKSDDTVRVWVPACATGEEAYSIGMLLLEYSRNLDAPPLLQVFASDLSEQAIHSARDGLYPHAIAADVSEDRLRRFFQKELRGYRVRRELREIVLFAMHDLLKDSPFSRMDLISCRNLFIYLDQNAQKTAFEIINFALNEKGFLFLGSSESAEQSSDLFSVLDKKNRIYLKRNSLIHKTLPLPFGATAMAMAMAMAMAKAMEMRERQLEKPLIPKNGQFADPRHATQGWQEFGDRRAALVAELHLKMIERFAPPSIVINQEHEIVHLSATAGRYLRYSGGEPSRNLLNAVHGSVRMELRAALCRAAETAQPTTIKEVRMPTDEGWKTVSIKVSLEPEIDENFLLVVFEPLEDIDNSPQLGAQVIERDLVAGQLERQLERTKSHLRDIVEQYEASTEELKASNEELQAMNEELHSATEELESSREELQSTNEELTTVNQELKSRVDELAQSNSDMHNLMGATAIASVFLDRRLCITRFTPSAVELFNLIPTDIGRPLSDLTHRLNYPQMQSDAEKVLNHLIPVECEVTEAGGKPLLARVLPYRTLQDHIAGVVLTFVDISQLKQAELLQHESEEQLRLIVENAHEYAIFSTDLNRKVTSWNSGAERLLGYSGAEIIGKSTDVIYTPKDRANGVPSAVVKRVLEHGKADQERFYVRKDGTQFWGSGSVMIMRDAQGEAAGFVKICRDHTAEREAREALEQRERELKEAFDEAERSRLEAVAANQSKDDFLAALSHELRNPLNPVLMGASALEDDFDLPGDTREIISMIRRNVELEARLIDDLLDITSLSRGRLKIEPIIADIHSLVRLVENILRSDMNVKGIELILKLEAEEHHLLVDPARLQQVLWNLLKNAIKFTDRGG